jgi:hypothetical protein
MKLAPSVEQKTIRVYEAMMDLANNLSVWEKAQLFACLKARTEFDKAPEAVQQLFVQLVVRSEL